MQGGEVMCEYCEGDKFILEDRYENGARSFKWMSLHSNGLLVFNTDGNEYERGEVYINYCPMCSRKLTEEK